ncbi:MAG TPA: 5-formyltetrahydrofolate cyclo-ligase [Egibacteraceae bacterium]|nr:5-formyltetrahydrofolate cyclo-ligase [Egibacteraceae bacterium]
MRDHSADAGGDATLLDAKRFLREEVWAALGDAGVARFPGAAGRIPNFTGAEAAAERLRDVERWKQARALKANPDSPQWPVRQRALADGIVVYMAVPRLAGEEPFFLLDPERIDTSPRKASSIKGASAQGRTAPVEELEPVDLVVTGCVAVDRQGGRLGKGGGFSDLEFALASAAGLIGERTLVVTTVHPLQVLERGRIPMGGHDVPVDLVVTPDEVIVCDRAHPRPSGIAWDDLTDEKIAAIPLLARLAGSR